jgi:hypothetical protein
VIGRAGGWYADADRRAITPWIDTRVRRIAEVPADRARRPERANSFSDFGHVPPESHDDVPFQTHRRIHRVC